ncbi:YwqH-like family protein [Virgibacillus sp. W0181]|uniref:YwqH-like family protein n=1 Tax=Virgibacillus sp. W0181 TaxID=3391581 RepID=UPI003F49025E
MDSLHIINGEISVLQSSIHSLNVQAEQKREELERLERVFRNLERCQNELQQHEQLCLSPELTPNSWHGQLAADFQNLRKSLLQMSYQALTNNQLEDSLSKIAAKIESLKQTIINLEASISTSNSRLYGLYADRRRELMS